MSLCHHHKHRCFKMDLRKKKRRQNPYSFTHWPQNKFMSLLKKTSLKVSW